MRLKDANEYLLGEPVTVSVTFTPETGPDAGKPTDPSALTVTLRAPDGTETSPAPSHDSTGVYSLLFTGTQAGYWSYRFVGTGAAAGVFEGTAWVRRSRV